MLPTVGLFEHAKGGGRGPAPEGGWHFWGSSAIKRTPSEHGVQALPGDPAGGRPVTGGSEGLANSEDPGRTWRPVTSPEQVCEEQVVVFWGLAYPPRSPWLSSARGRGVGSSHVQERGSETPAPRPPGPSCRKATFDRVTTTHVAELSLPLPSLRMKDAPHCNQSKLDAYPSENHLSQRQSSKPNSTPLSSLPYPSDR